ncbi:MAG: cytochrome c [Deferribacteres bacterium]|nr:cytochrome c [candidate division KSB1 bacterium]MCB9501302.1 cytochrome c [Deferribacteres bacterium]
MKLFKTLPGIILLAFLIACGGDKSADKTTEKPANPGGLTDFEMENGIGPIKEKMQMGEIDAEAAKKGEATFTVKCALCHKLDERFIGPSQRYTADRRTPEYILNMILNPDEMTKSHPTGQKMLAEYKTPMTNMNLTVDEAKEVLEYLRLIAKEGHEKNIPAVPIYQNEQ